MSEETTVQENTTAVAVTIPTPEELKNMTKEDLEKLKQDISQLPTVIEEAIAEKVKEEAGEVKTWAENFREKNGISVWVALVGGAFIVFEVIPAILRGLGVK